MIPDEPYIKAGSLRALIEGNNLDDDAFVLAKLEQQFGIAYPVLPDYYPFDRYLELLNWLRQELYPHEPASQGYEKLGRQITQGMFRGAVGQLLKKSAELLGVQRGLYFFFKILGGALVFGTIETQEHRPGYVRFILWNVPGPPEVTSGMILEAMQAAKVKQSQISFHKPGLNDTEFEVRWQE